MINPNMLCMRCMSHLNTENGICPNCGFDNTSPVNEPHQLECRSILAGAYLVGCVLGQGGFGITYTGWDLNLDIKIAIKEYYPLGFAARDSHTHVSVVTLGGDKREYYQKGMERFVNEAKTLARLTRDSSIVGVRGFFYENGTAYIIMDFVEGETLKSLAAKRGGKLPAQETLQMFRPLCDSLARVHAAELLHRDISPDNIIRRPDGTLTLVDFGAARQISAYGEHSNTINVKHGFAPEEQYRTHGEQGPWTDVYALCATIYCLITGTMPPQALDRLTSGATITSPRQLGADITPAQENALLHGLGVNAQYRTRDIQTLVKELYEGVKTPTNHGAANTGGTAKQPSDPFHAPEPKKERKKTNIKTIAIIAGSSVGVYLLILLGLGVLNGKPQPKEDTQPVVAKATAVVTAAPTEAPTPEPTEIPNPSELYLTLGFGEMYLCTIDDFDETYGLSDDDVTWKSNDTELVTCTDNGIVLSANLQRDITEGYSDYVEVTGEASNGVKFVYQVEVGNGKTYSFAWSNSARTLKDSISYTYIATPAITNCVGFTLDFKYEAATGSHTGAWVFWVHDQNGTWIDFPNLYLEDGVTSSYDLTFDHPVNVDEVVMQPVSTYNTKKFEFYTYYDISNLLFK